MGKVEELLSDTGAFIDYFRNDHLGIRFGVRSCDPKFNRKHNSPEPIQDNDYRLRADVKMSNYVEGTPDGYKIWAFGCNMTVLDTSSTLEITIRFRYNKNVVLIPEVFHDFVVDMMDISNTLAAVNSTNYDDIIKSINTTHIKLDDYSVIRDEH